MVEGRQRNGSPARGQPAFDRRRRPGGVLVGRSLRVAALGDAFWLATDSEAPELVLLAGAHLEYIFPTGIYYLFGEAGLCWHVLSPWDSGRSSGRAPGYAVGAGYRFARSLSVEAKCSFSGYDQGEGSDVRYRHLAVLAGLRGAIE